jgi:alpha-D-ribose 1-methylphosphonate 5-triphosphate diphosphatase
VVELFSRPKRPLLAFNDHTTPSLAGIRKDVKIRGSAERAMVELDAYRELLLGISSFSPAVPEAINAVASAAASQGVVMLSHDDCTIAMRQGYRRKGASVAEFPMNWETLDEAGAAGDSIVLGSPNVVRGGSHNGAISAEEAIARQLCNILASDYYYPAPLQAALALVSRGRLPLEAAWNLISRTPAEACALTDRGIIAEGMRADLVVIPQHGSRPKATIAGGRLVYSHH